MTASSDSNELDLSRLPDGAYFVRLLGENGTSVRKIIKKSN